MAKTVSYIPWDDECLQFDVFLLENEIAERAETTARYYTYIFF